MNWSIVGVIPWQEAMHSNFVISLFMEKIYGMRTARVATLLVLWIAFASLFAVVLGYSRVPYAAAADGNFFPVFARLHPKKDFPYVSLLVCRRAGFLFQSGAAAGGCDQCDTCDADPGAVRGAGGGGGAAATSKGTAGLPFRMWLYPAPVILSVASGYRLVDDRVGGAAGSIPGGVRDRGVLCGEG